MLVQIGGHTWSLHDVGNSVNHFIVASKLLIFVNQYQTSCIYVIFPLSCTYYRGL